MKPVYIVNHLQIDNEDNEHTQVEIEGIYDSYEKALNKVNLIVSECYDSYDEEINYYGHIDKIQKITDEIEQKPGFFITGYVKKIDDEYTLINGCIRDINNPNKFARLINRGLKNSGSVLLSIEKKNIE